ncbi:MAG: M23 family metallopeptidase [Thermomicrobiales bacterium]
MHRTKALAAPVSRRTIALAGSSLLALAAMPTLAHEGHGDATPEASPEVATPSASPVANPVPAPTTAEVLPAYQDLADQIRTTGQAVLDPLLSGDSAPFAAAWSPEAARTLPASEVGSIVAQLQANQVRFSFAEVGAHWSGTVGDGAIAGFFQQAGTRDTFTLTPKGAAPASSPAAVASPVTSEATPAIAARPYPAGIWSGSLDTLKLPFEIAFSGDESHPAATITIAEQGIIEAPLGDVAFLPEAPFGAVAFDRAIPLSPAFHTYGQVRDWAGAEAQIDLTLGGDTVTSIQIQPTIILPEDPAAGYVSEVTYRLPWQAGAWFTFWGGDTEYQNYHAIAPGQRHALDIVVWKDGSTFAGDGASADHYWIWGQPLVSPAAGTVVETLNDQPDQVPGPSLSETDPDAFKTLHPAGNHIVLQTAEREFVYMAHMQHGSVRVRKGDVLKAGDPVGLVGNSGNTSEPHLHLHIQNVADFYDPQAVGLPVVFTGLTIDGKPTSSGSLQQGTFAEPVAS